MKMKVVSNIASLISVLFVVVVFILKCMEIVTISMTDVFKTAGFIKIAFLQVDISCWLKNIFAKSL